MSFQTVVAIGPTGGTGLTGGTDPTLTATGTGVAGAITAEIATEAAEARTADLSGSQELDDGSNYATFREVDALLTKSYNSSSNNNATICNIIAVYLKGQKLLYAEAKTHCEQKLHFLMLPSIFFTVVGSVLNLTIKDTPYGNTIVSGLNAFIAFLLAVVNYLKLDARAEAHRTSAYKFDKLEQQLVFNSGKAMFMSYPKEQMETLVTSTEKDVREIKETNQFILPEDIRYSYPLLCGTNVFAKVKDVQTEEMILTDQLKDILNDMTELETKNPPPPRLESRLEDLRVRQRAVLREILELRKQFLRIDTQFEEEIQRNRRKCSKRFQLCGCLKV